MNRITREELKDILDNGGDITLVEALPEMYWRKSHIPGAMQIDYTEIQILEDLYARQREGQSREAASGQKCQNSRLLCEYRVSELHESGSITRVAWLQGSLRICRRQAGLGGRRISARFRRQRQMNIYGEAIPEG